MGDEEASLINCGYENCVQLVYYPSTKELKISRGCNIKQTEKHKDDKRVDDKKIQPEEHN